jgi:hypothetical protein
MQPAGHPQPCMELDAVDGLGDQVVRAAIQRFCELLVVAERGHHDDVERTLRRHGHARFPA